MTDVLSDCSAVLLAESIPLGAVMIDPKKNVSRAGRWLSSEHPTVRRAAADIERRGLLEPVGLRLLDRPVSRPCGGPCCSEAAMDRDGASCLEHLVEVRYGFARLSGLISLGRTELRLAQPSVEATVHETMTDSEAEEACLAENLVRTDPSDYELALHLRTLSTRPEYAAMRPRERTAEIAKRFKLPSAYFVESCIRIVERCPPALLDEWDSRSDEQTRKILDRVSRVDQDSAYELSDRHEAMTRLYGELRAAADAGNAGRERLRVDGKDVGGGAKAQPAVSRGRVERLLGRLELATEVYDERASAFRPMSAGERETARAVVRYLAGGKGAAEPVR